MRHYAGIKFLVLAMPLALGLLPGLAAAAGNAPAADSLTGAYFRFVAALVLVIGVMLLLYALVKKRFSLLHNRTDNLIRVVETRPVAPRASLCLVEVRGQEFLLGLSQNSINLLTAFEIEKARRQPDGPAASQSFDSFLQSSRAAKQAASPISEQP